MKKTKLILMILLVSVITGGLFEFGVIRLNAQHPIIGDPHQAVLDICGPPPPSPQIPQPQQDPIPPCEGGSANCDPQFFCAFASSPETLSYAFGVNCLNLVPAGAADNCAADLIATRLALTFAFQYPGFSTSEPLQVRIDINGVRITSIPGIAFSRGTTPVFSPDSTIGFAGIIQPSGMTQGVFSIFIYPIAPAPICVPPAPNPAAPTFDLVLPISCILNPPGQAPPSCPNALPPAPDGQFPPHCVTSDNINVLDVTILSGEGITFTDIQAIISFP